MKKYIYTIVLSTLLWSCGGSGGDTPEPENNAPNVPTLLYPEALDLDKIICVDNVIEFKWNAATDPDGDNVTYQIEIAKDKQFTNIIDESVYNYSSTKIIISLEKGVAYYWRVSAKDNKNKSSEFSTANLFYTEGEVNSNYLPSSPEILAPSLNATVTELIQPLTLKWKAAIDPDNDTLTYDVYFATDKKVVEEAREEYFEKIIDNPDFDTEYRIGKDQSQTTLTYNDLEASTNYFWIVVVKDDNGGQTIGQVWNFKTD